MKIRFQLSKNYQVVEVESEVEFKNAEQASVQLREFAEKQLDLIAGVAKKETTTAVKAESKGFEMSPKQWGLVKFLGGDQNKKFATAEEFDAYIKELQAKKPNGEVKEQAPKTDDVPWELEL